MSTTRPPRVFISRTTAGLAALAERVAEVLRQRGIEPIIQTGFYPSTHDIKGMLAEHWGLERKAVPKDQADWGAGCRARPPQQCDAVICLIGTAYGSGPHDPITKAEQPVHGLKDPRTKDRLFSYTQLELLIARDLGRPIYTFFIQGDALPTAFDPEPPALAQRQQTFITEFAKDGRNTYGTFSQWDQPADPARGLKQAIEAIQFEITVLAGKPTNLPYTSLGTLFKGRDSSSPNSASTSPPKAPSSSKASAPSTAWAASARPAPPSNTPGNTPTTTAPSSSSPPTPPRRSTATS